MSSASATFCFQLLLLLFSLHSFALFSSFFFVHCALSLSIINAHKLLRASVGHSTTPPNGERGLGAGLVAPDARLDDT